MATKKLKKGVIYTTRPNSASGDVMVWRTKDLREIPLSEMPREHVRNCLQWCLKREPMSHIYHYELAPNMKDKDGYYYSEWIVAFINRLLDPACE